MKSPISIFLADDHPIVRDGLRDILEQHDRFVIAGEAGDGEEVLRCLRINVPDVLILDIEMPKKSGLEVARAIRDEGIGVLILILTMYNQESIFNRAMDLGVMGYMLKDSAGEDVIRGIEAVLSGEYYISPALNKYVMRGQKSTPQHPLSELTPSERKVFGLIASSRTTNQIAEELHLSPRTIEHHRERICNKLNLSGSYALLRYALENKSLLDIA
ncbi:MAG: response regulator transcription factor [Bacteroidia bacterium]|nr:response regulator transcription factor [Bacteroidia bacterium]